MITNYCRLFQKNISLHGLENCVGQCQPMVLWYNNPHMEVTGKDIIKEQENKRKNIT